MARELGKRRIAFLCLRESVGPDSLGKQIKKAFGGVLIANEGFTLQTAAAAVEAGRVDAVAWGRMFIANPDLPERFRTKSALNEPNPETFYLSGAAGYIDYPVIQ